MGKTVVLSSFTREDYRHYRHKVRRCLDVLAQMLDHFDFDEDKPMTGLEVEVNLIDDRGDPAMVNTEVLSILDDAGFQQELGLFNLEANVPPRLICGDGLAQYERYLRDAFDAVQAKAKTLGAGLVLIGILPTITPEHTVLDNVSANPRYRTLNEQIVNAR